MKCAGCGAKFGAADGQPAPGGSSAPGVYVLVGVPLAVATAVTFWLDVPYVPWVGLAITVFVAMQIPIAWSDCRGTAGGAGEGGGTCPKCGAANRVRWWSL